MPIQRFRLPRVFAHRRPSWYIASVALGALLLAGVGAARAVTTDTGWTQEVTSYGNLGNFAPSPNCYPECSIWNLGSTITVYNNMPGHVIYQPQINFAMSAWNSARRTGNAPYFVGTTNPAGPKVIVGLEQTTVAECAHTSYTVQPTTPDGGRNQWTLVGAVVLVQNNNNPCAYNTFGMMAHEFGHVTGLGHTNNAGQLMYPYASHTFSTPQARDVCGFNHIYSASYGC
ncbi:MAG: matrixin family metalloprotease [Acidimicrobiia bacterium]|nr:matrixin family metalloprotease [Acidimicrobiia bacterium]